MIKNLLFLFLSLLFFFCGCGRPPAKHIVLADKHAARYSKQLKKEGFFLCGYGGRMHGNIQAFYLTYVYHKKLNIEGARRLYIPVVQAMIEQVNNDSEIQPFLNHSPATIDNFEIMISFRDNKNKHVTDEYVALVYCVRQTIFYDIYDPINDQLVEVYQEPYEVAKAIVMRECSSDDS